MVMMVVVTMTVVMVMMVIVVMFVPVHGCEHDTTAPYPYSLFVRRFALDPL